MAVGNFKFSLTGENVCSYHSDGKDYYEEPFEEVTDEHGWVVCLNMPEQTQLHFKHAHFKGYIELLELENLRTYNPYHLFTKSDRN
jgi:hypothetical protein